MVRYMLHSGNSEIPVMFLDRDDLGNVVNEAYKGNLQDGNDDDVTEIQVDADADIVSAMANLTVLAMAKPTGCIVTFDNGNSLCMVGSSSSFYMIDLSNGIFCHTSGPEYDVQSYVNEFGSDHFKLQYFAIKPEPAPTPKKKSTKKRTRPKESTPPPAVEEEKEVTKTTTTKKKTK